MRQKLFIDATPLINKHLSGVGQVVLSTLRALDTAETAASTDVYVFVPFDEVKKLNKYVFKYVGVKVLPYPHKFHSLFSRLRFAPPIDLFLGRGVYVFPNFRNWNLCMSTSITYIHDVCFAIYPEYVQPENLRYLRKYITLWIGRADRIVTVSDQSKKEIIQQLHVPADKVSVVKNTVDTSLFKPQDDPAIKDVKEKYSLTHKYHLFIGNIEPRKNLQTLIDAFVLNGDTISTLFIVGGDGWLNQSVYSSINDARAKGFDVRKNDTYVPDQDLPALIAGADSLVLPSWHEGYGLPAVQAAACGTRALCADIPALRELEGQFGKMIEYFSPDDSKALAQLLGRPKSTSSSTTVERTWGDAARELMKITRESRGESK